MDPAAAAAAHHQHLADAYSPDYALGRFVQTKCKLARETRTPLLFLIAAFAVFAVVALARALLLQKPQQI